MTSDSPVAPCGPSVVSSRENVSGESGKLKNAGKAVENPTDSALRERQGDDDDERKRR
jgi:hypothetical protein